MNVLKLLVLLFILPLYTSAQNIISAKKYECKNGFRVELGDTIFLAEPIGNNGNYKTIFKDKSFGKNIQLTKADGESYLVVKRIAKYEDNTFDSYAHLQVEGVNVKNYTIAIEDAIIEKEILLPKGFIPLDIPTNDNNEKQYTASNGVLYKVGDLIELGKGSNADGSFVHLRVSGWGAALGADTRIGAGYTGQKVIIKSILYERSKRRGYEKVWMMVGGGNITNYSIDIESAIKSCEVVPCNDVSRVQVVNKPLSVADEIKKLYEMKEEGILTEQEYEQQKKKLLSK